MPLRASRATPLVIAYRTTRKLMATALPECTIGDELLSVIWVSAVQRFLMY